MSKNAWNIVFRTTIVVIIITLTIVYPCLHQINIYGSLKSNIIKLFLESGRVTS